MTLVYSDLEVAGYEQLASDPVTALFVGRVYQNTGTKQVRWYDGTSWKNTVSDGQTATDVNVLSTTAGAASPVWQAPRMTTSERTALVSPLTGRLVYDTTLKSLFIYNGTTWIPAGGGSALTSTITQSSHGFVAADLGCALYINGSGVYTKARSDASNTAEVVGLLYNVVDANTFNIAMAGEVTVDSAQTGGAMTVGANYFLSPTTAGQLTATEPTTVGHVSLPIGVAKSATVLVVNIMRGVVVGGANVRTSISLANNATTTIQSLAAYEAAELTGWVSIAATTPLKFYLQAQVAKNGAGTDYSISWQSSGDSFPVGFNVTVTAAGLVQVVMPNVTGFTSASINYALNAPAVGTAFPLSVSARSVIGDVSGTAVPSGMIGQIITTGQLSASITTSGTAFGFLDVPAGCWLLIGQTTWYGTGSAASGFVVALNTTINSVSGTPGVDVASSPIDSANQASGVGGACVSITKPVNISSTTRYYLNANTISGSFTGKASIQAIRIA